MKQQNVKPILVIRFPREWDINNLEKAAKVADKIINGAYFIFTIRDAVKTIKFETYNVTDAVNVDLNELKKQLKLQK
jgi:hypothetical protein